MNLSTPLTFVLHMLMGQIDFSWESEFLFLSLFTINFTFRDCIGRITDYFETTCTGNN